MTRARRVRARRAFFYEADSHHIRAVRNRRRFTECNREIPADGDEVDGLAHDGDVARREKRDHATHATRSARRIDSCTERHDSGHVSRARQDALRRKA